MPNGTVMLRVRVSKRAYWRLFHAAREGGENFPASIERRLVATLSATDIGAKPASPAPQDRESK